VGILGWKVWNMWKVLESDRGALRNKCHCAASLCVEKGCPIRDSQFNREVKHENHFFMLIKTTELEIC